MKHYCESVEAVFAETGSCPEGLSAEESDLSGAGPFRRDADSLAVMPFWMLRPLAWAFLLLAAALLAAHHLVLTRKGGGPC